MLWRGVPEILAGVVRAGRREADFDVGHGFVAGHPHAARGVCGTFLLFIILLLLYRKAWNRRPGLVIGVYLAGYGCLRFLLEFLRGDPRAAVGPFSIGQTISIGLWILAAGFIAHAFVKGAASDGPKE